MIRKLIAQKLIKFAFVLMGGRPVVVLSDGDTFDYEFEIYFANQNEVSVLNDLMGFKFIPFQNPERTIQTKLL